MDCSITIKHLNVVDSTNRYVRDEAESLWVNGKDFIAVVANHQTAGRGQRGNVWSSQSGNNLLLSLLMRPGRMLEVSHQFLLSQMVAVAIHSSMEKYGIDTHLKWPNDIYVGSRKLAGILVELDYSGTFVEQAIVGIGLNVNQTIFPKMDRVPVSMKMLSGNDFAIEEVLDSVLCSVSDYYGKMRCNGADFIRTEYNTLLLGFGEPCKYSDAAGVFEAVIEGVEPTGHLLLRRSDGTLSRYAFKEVERLL